MRRSIVWMGFGQSSFFLLQLVGSVIIARLLGPYDTGVFAVAMAAVGLVGVIQSVGLDSYIIREAELTSDIVATAATVNAVIAALMSAALLAAALTGDRLFHEPGVGRVLTVIAIVPLIGCVAFVPQAMLEREGDFRLLAIVKAASTFLGLVLTVAMAADGLRYMSFAYSQVATAVITNAALVWIARRHASWRFSVRHWSAISRFGAQIFAIAGLTRVAGRTADLVLGRTLGLAALGLYSRASSNHNQIWDSVHGVVSRVVFVDFARRVHEGLPLRDRYLVILAMMTGLLWPLFGGAAVLAGPIIHYVYGPAWHGAAAPLAFLCVASMVLVSTTMAWEIFVVREETARQVKFEAIRTLLGTALFVACCFYSLAAAAASRVAEALLAQALYRPSLERMTQTTRAEFRRVYLKSGCATLAAVAPAAITMAAFGFVPDVPWPWLVAAVALGVGLWVVALWALAHPLFDEIARIMRLISVKARFAR